MMKIDIEKAKERYDNFLMIMDDQLDGLRDQAESRNIELDGSVNDLDRLEALFALLSDGADKETTSSLVVSFARYLGELVRVIYGGRWLLSLEDEKNPNFNTPVIVGHSSIKDLEFAPISVMRAFALRKKPGTLARAVEADINVRPIDLGGLIEK